MTRPKFNKSISLKDFKDYYWLKEELICFCREFGISTSGGKLDLTERIIDYLLTGNITSKAELNKKRCESNFDWKHEKLDANTLITDNYKNTENVRAFFKKEIGNSFKFNVEFMNWMKSSTGKRLGDAIEKWLEIVEKIKDKNYISEIAPQFEYNTYIRDFLSDNPELSVKDAINCWKIKRGMPVKKVYNKKDLGFVRK